MKQNRFLQYLYFLFLKDTFALAGRASRLQYIARTFVVIGLYALIALSPPSAVLSGILAMIIFLYSLLHTLLTVRRLHDLDFSGCWLFLIMLLSPLGLILMILFSIIRGTKGENDYGKESKFKKMN